MKTKTAAILYLLSKGVPHNIAKASVDQAYHGCPQGSDQMYGYDIFDCELNQLVPVQMDENAVWLMHEIIGDSLSIVEGGIAVFGVLTYNVNGDLLFGPTTLH